MTDKKVLLIGGGGFIGSWVSRRFAEDGWKVTILDDFRNRTLDVYEDSLIRVILNDLPNTMVLDESLLDEATTEETLRVTQPDVVVYLAGASTVEDAASQAAFQESNMALMIALEACKIGGGKRPHFVYVSSSMVYGDFQSEPVTEDHPLNPVNMYGVMKVTGEKLVISSGLPATIVRPTSVYGASDSHQRVIKRFCEAALLGKTLEVRGNSRLDFTHVSDTAKGIFLAATIFKPVLRNDSRVQAYNISAGHAISILEAAQTIATCSERETLIAHYEHEHDLDRRPIRGALDITKARKELGYNPTAVFEEEVSRYMNKHLIHKWAGAVTQDPKYYVYEKKVRKSA